MPPRMMFYYNEDETRTNQNVMHDGFESTKTPGSPAARVMTSDLFNFFQRQTGMSGDIIIREASFFE